MWGAWREAPSVLWRRGPAHLLALWSRTAAQRAHHSSGGRCMPRLQGEWWPRGPWRIPGLMLPPKTWDYLAWSPRLGSWNTAFIMSFFWKVVYDGSSLNQGLTVTLVPIHSCSDELLPALERHVLQCTPACFIASHRVCNLRNHNVQVHGIESENTGDEDTPPFRYPTV